MQRPNRLTASRDFERILGAGVRLTRPEFVLYHCAREASDVPRFGFAVPRRIGGAVVRNRARRILREAARQLVPRLVPCDVVIVARPPIVSCGVRDLEVALADVAARAGLILTT